jgi:alpha-D-xyloside xylohydrolase
MTMREMSTLYPLVYHKVAYEVTQRLRPDSVVRFARSGYAGSQGFSINWGGDQLADWTPDHGLPSVIPAGITAGLSGYAVWAPDIMSWGLSKELWMRWVEFGALTPIMRDHLEQRPKFAVDLFFDLQTLDTFRRYAKLHNSLFPYLYTYADRATKTGLPIIRHLMLEWPNDPHTYTADHEYMLGRQILVAPVVKQGARTRDLYLPEGAWVDYWTGEILHGGVQAQVPAPLERIPILVRAGSVIPFASPDTQTLAEDLAGSKRRMGDDIIWRVFPGQASTQGSFVLYDGTQATARQGPEHVEVRVEHSPIVRQYEVVLPAKRPARMVKLSGKSLEEADCSAIEKGRAGWCADSRGGILRVRFAADNFDLQVVKH